MGGGGKGGGGKTSQTQTVRTEIPDILKPSLERALKEARELYLRELQPQNPLLSPISPETGPYEIPALRTPQRPLVGPTAKNVNIRNILGL